MLRVVCCVVGVASARTLAWGVLQVGPLLATILFHAHIVHVCMLYASMLHCRQHGAKRTKV
jgi:hypothetical protein